MPAQEHSQDESARPKDQDGVNNNEDENVKPKKQAVLAPLPLEWTKLGNPNAPSPSSPAATIRYPWDVISLAPSDDSMEALEIVGTSGQKITRMGSDLSQRYPNLTTLVLRSHLIRTMEGLAKLEKLEILELYDNMIDELRDLNNGSGNKDENSADDNFESRVGFVPGGTLRVLDISYNVIRDMGPVEFCPNLQELLPRAQSLSLRSRDSRLDIAQNKIKSIRGLRHLTHLRKIDLGANRIRVMDKTELEGLVNLEELWLGKNKIERIEGLTKLTKLRKLDVQSNRLIKIENLTSQVDTLEELYLAHNGIDIYGARCETGLALPFTALNTIDLSRNKLTDTTPFSHLTSLSELWISGNEIKSFQDVEPLSNLPNLEGIYLEYNPVASEFEYRKKLAELIPSLNQIDANMIGGLAAHGYASVIGGSLEDRMRQLQDTVIEKATDETRNFGKEIS
ncbi:hypothetical protein HJC23_000240 [Cyclotella cryptica]|uniref:L domain-like protein n=1 Tax=Cyclotella cryptica TaxID=29204 RepID=A0ABD3PNL8_9STRA|eukprot:CCRYP_013409-RA/>CCRYP_013409-RA protein AED:0.04 eAED:0.04 QI:157/0.5/0.66/1/1/1/3/348/452